MRTHHRKGGCHHHSVITARGKPANDGNIMIKQRFDLSSSAHDCYVFCMLTVVCCGPGEGRRQLVGVPGWKPGRRHSQPYQPVPLAHTWGSAYHGGRRTRGCREYWVYREHVPAVSTEYWVKVTSSCREYWVKVTCSCCELCFIDYNLSSNNLTVYKGEMVPCQHLWPHSVSVRCVTDILSTVCDWSARCWANCVWRRPGGWRR